MVNKKVPDAWEDDWEPQADKAAIEEETARASRAPKTKAERLAEHAELQRKLWTEAYAYCQYLTFLTLLTFPREAPKEPYYVPSSNVPLVSGFKPAMKLLSRKPATLNDDDDDGEATKHQPTPEEIRQRQQRDLEEKQRRYDEARAKIFGATPKSGSPSGTSTPGITTPPLSGEGRQNSRGRGGRGGRGRGGQRRDNNNNNNNNSRNDGERPTSQSDGRSLFDPDSSSRPGSSATPRRGGEGATTPRVQDTVIRMPRGPDGSGRGGFGFAKRDSNEG